MARVAERAAERVDLKGIELKFDRARGQVIVLKEGLGLGCGRDDGRGGGALAIRDHDTQLDVVAGWRNDSRL